MIYIFVPFVNKIKRDTIINSNTQNIANTLFSVISVLIIDIASIFNKLSKFLLNIKCRLTEK